MSGFGRMILTDVPPNYYWDACAWLGLINTEADKHRNLKSFWDAAAAGHCKIWTSSYSYLEVLKATAQGGDPYTPEESDRRIDQALEQPYVFRVNLDSEVARLARQLRRQFPNELKKKADAIHLATACWWDLDALHTYDDSHLLPLNGKAVRSDGKPLLICVPDPLADTMFAASVRNNNNNDQS